MHINDITYQLYKNLSGRSGSLNDLQKYFNQNLPEILRSSLKVGVVGTSLVQQGEKSSSNDTSPTSKGWMHWAQIFSGYRFECVNWYDPTVVEGWEPSGVAGTTRNFWGMNAGVSGQKVQDIWDRIERVSTDFQKAGVGVVIVDAGTNDMVPETKEYIQGLREQIAVYLRDRGFKVILCTILSRDITGTATPWTSGSIERKKMNWINKKSRTFCDSTDGVWLWDWNENWMDFTSSDGVPKTGYSNDGTHFASAGAFYVGQHLNELIQGIMPLPLENTFSPDDQFDATDNPLGNLLVNPYCKGTSGSTNTGTSGDVADNMRTERVSGTGTLAASKVARADGKGDWQQLTITPTDASLFRFRTTSANTGVSDLQGKWVQFEADIEVDAYAGYDTLELEIVDQDGTDGRSVKSLDILDGNIPDESFTGKMKTYPLYLQEDTANIRIRFVVGVDGTAGSPVVRVSNLHCYPVPDPREHYGIGHTA